MGCVDGDEANLRDDQGQWLLELESLLIVDPEFRFDVPDRVGLLLFLLNVHCDGLACFEVEFVQGDGGADYLLAVGGDELFLVLVLNCNDINHELVNRKLDFRVLHFEVRVEKLAEVIFMRGERGLAAVPVPKVVLVVSVVFVVERAHHPLGQKDLLLLLKYPLDLDHRGD